MRVLTPGHTGRRAEGHMALHWRRVALALDLASTGLWRARRRLVLAVLGVGIGFGAIHALLLLGRSAEARIQALLNSLGGDVVNLTVSSNRTDWPTGPHRANRPRTADPAALLPNGLTAPDLTALLRRMDSVEATAWAQRGCRSGQDTDALMDLTRVSADLSSLLQLQPEAGRLLQPVDQGQPTVVLGADAWREVRAKLPLAALGSVIPVCGRPLRVVGILQRHAGSDLLPELGVNNAALVLGTAEQLGNTPDDLHLLVRLRAGSDSREVAEPLRSRMAALLPRRSVAATAAWNVLQARQAQTTLYTNFLAILGGVALAIGTLGIANIMLVSVTERTAEIGLRMAIGARRSDIVLQFMAEGVLICLLGSAVGLVGGSVVAALTLSMAGIDLVLPLSVAVQATALAVACGIAAAAFPAYRAACLQPRQALAAG